MGRSGTRLGLLVALLVALTLTELTSAATAGATPTAEARSSGRSGLRGVKDAECSQWDATGTWQLRVNNASPILAFAPHAAKVDQTGAIELAGTVTLPAGQWQNAGWTQPTNGFTGRLIADQLTFLVTAPHRSGFLSLGKYEGTVTDGAAVGTAKDLNAPERGSIPWTATGSTTCIEFGTSVGSDLEDLVNELALDPVQERHEELCPRGYCSPAHEHANALSQAFEELFCAGSQPHCGSSVYERRLPTLVYLTSYAAGLDADGHAAFPSVRGAMPVILQMAFHGATDTDPASARAAASAAWRLFATLALVDLEVSK